MPDWLMLLVAQLVGGVVGLGLGCLIGEILTRGRR
jgi:hypothetical protein